MKFVQYTNQTIGAVTANTAMPLGVKTQGCMSQGCAQPTFTGTATGINVVNLNETGKFRISYSATLIGAAEGDVAISLVVNNEVVDSATASLAASGDYADVDLDFIVRVCKNCSSITTNFPATVQVVLGAVALTGGNSNLIIEKIAD